MFDYYGKIGKFIIFTTDNKRALPKERQKAIDEYLSTRKISVTTYLILWIFFAFFVAQLVLQKNQIQEFLTNGSILNPYSVSIGNSGSVILYHFFSDFCVIPILRLFLIFMRSLLALFLPLFFLPNIPVYLFQTSFSTLSDQLVFQRSFQGTVPIY